MSRPAILAFSGKALFDSFFSEKLILRLEKSFTFERIEARKISPSVRKRLATADAMITTWDSPAFGADLTAIAPKLRIIAHCGGEVKRRFDASLFDRLTITNAPGPMARPTAELGAAFLLHCTRNIDSYRGELRKRSNRIYQSTHTTGGGIEALAGREVSMIGFGRIGRALIDLLAGFDLRWLVYDPYARRDLARTRPVTLAPLHTVLKRGHLLVLTAAATKKSQGMISAERLAILPDNAAVINIARGSLLDLAALTEEVRTGRLRCALDVTDPDEPLPIGHPLRTMPGAILTPHIAGGGQQVRNEIAAEVIDDLHRFFTGQAVRNRVTRDMLERMT